MTNRRKVITIITLPVMLILSLTAASYAGSFNYRSGFGFMGGSNSYTEIKVGYYNPKGDLNGGLLLGLATGSQVDESVSLSLEVNFWRKVFEKKIPVDVDTSIIGVPTTTTKVLYKHTVNYIPVLLTLKFELPVGPEAPISPFAGVSAGYAFSYISYKFNDPSVAESGVITSPDKGFYGGWNWRVFGGASIMLGSMSKLNLGVLYNGAKVSKSESDGIERELDLKGFGLYASISLLGM